MDAVTTIFFNESGNHQVEALPWRDKTIEQGMILMQFTGLKDRTGKEIYEGDIVRYQMPGPPPEDLMIECIEPIIFSVASFDVEGAPLYVVSDVCEVIGNIYENGYLLNQPSEERKPE